MEACTELHMPDNIIASTRGRVRMRCRGEGAAAKPERLNQGGIVKTRSELRQQRGGIE